jgi:FkbM family methyltransferase
MYDANRNLDYICIEADEGFFGLLQENLLRIKAIDESASIQAIRALVGSRITDVSLDGTGGTKKAIIGDSKNPISSESLDHILSLSKATNIKLLKSDVDGFDYDVIDSADSTLNSCSPILFFECHFDHMFQKAGYQKTIANLQSRGYGRWVIFDNFGEVILRTNDIQQINQLFDYVWRQNVKRTTRTIFYYDILAATKRDHELIDRVIDDYIASS